MANKAGLTEQERFNDLQRKRNRELAVGRAVQMFPDANRAQLSAIASDFEGILNERTIRPVDDGVPLLGGFDSDPVQPQPQQPEQQRPGPLSNTKTPIPLIAPGVAAAINPRSLSALPNLVEESVQPVQDQVNLAPLIGGIAGAPTLSGSVFGAGLGAVVTSTLSDEQSSETLLEGAQSVAKEMLIEAAGGKAFDVVGGGAARFFRGNREVAERAAAALRRRGIEPSLQDISDTSLVEGGRRVLGSFPMLRKHFRKRLDATSKAFSRVSDELVSEVSPDTLLVRRYARENSPEAAQAVVDRMARGGYEAIGEGYEVMRRVTSERWARVESAAAQIEAAHESVGRQFASKMENTSVRLAQVIDDLKGREVLEAGSDGIRVAKGFEDESIGKAAKFVSEELGRTRVRSFSDLRNLKRKISLKIDGVRDNPEAVTILTRFKEGVEEDIEALLRNGDAGLRKLYDEANAVSEEFITLLGELSGRRMRRFQSGAGRQAIQEVETAGGNTLLKGAGTRDPGLIIDDLASNGTPKEMGQLFEVMRQAVGEKGARKVVGDVLGRRLSQSLDVSVRESIEKSGDPSFIAPNFLKRMGLDDPGSKRYASTVEMFRQIGINPQKATDMAEVMQSLFGVKNPKVSDFIARRGLLGGASSILSGVTGGLIGGATATGTGMLGPAAFFLLGRSFSKWMTSPRRARLVLAVADNRAPQHFRAGAMRSLLTDPEIYSGIVNSIMPRGASQEEQQSIESSARELRDDALRQLNTRSSREAFFKNIDNEFDFSNVDKSSR